MKSAPLPVDEKQRLEALKNYKILDTLPEQDFDDITHLAAQICGTPIALISLIDEHRQWFKSRVGLDAPETSREVAFCAHAILGDDLFEVKDSSKDDRFHDNPLFTAAPHVQFYAGAPLITPEGYKIGTLCVIDNHPRDLKDEQKDSLQALSRQVINQVELRLAKRKADQANYSKSRFLANMSHEIRTPMNAVISGTQLLIDDIKDDKHRRILRMIDNAGENLLTLINDILDFSKIESGNLTLENNPFDLHSCLEDIVALLNNRAEKQNVKLSLSINSKTPVWVSGDSTRFRQIVINLVGNAIKFCNSSVEVFLEPETIDDKQYVVLSVKDDGIGISKKNQKKIFQDFNQIDASITRKYGGTGLGLSICRGLTKAMQGELWVESELSIGSTFFACVSLEPSEQGETVTKPALSEINPDLAQQLPLNILLAEDDEVNQIIIQQMFEKIGYQIDIAENGQKCIDALQSKTYDIIFMDMQMPILDGLATTHTIRNSDFQQPRIIALTANAFAEDKEACLTAGMNGFITKPVDLNEIVTELNKLKQAS